MEYEQEALVNHDPTLIRLRDTTPFKIFNFGKDISQIVKLFSNCGTVEKIIALPEPNCNRCFVTMGSAVEAFFAKKSYDGKEYNSEVSEDKTMRSFFKMKVEFIDTFFEEEEPQECY